MHTSCILMHTCTAWERCIASYESYLLASSYAPIFINCIYYSNTHTLSMNENASLFVYIALACECCCCVYFIFFFHHNKSHAAANLLAHIECKMHRRKSEVGGRGRGEGRKNWVGQIRKRCSFSTYAKPMNPVIYCPGFWMA